MHYQKLLVGKTFIEFHNNWLGEETVVVNGQIVSRKSSIWGIHHYFTVIENGRTVRYILTSKADLEHNVSLDLRRNGEILQRNIPVPARNSGAKRYTRPRSNPSKKSGLAKLREYELEEALANFDKALEVDPRDPEIYFHKACAYSNLERTVDGFEALRKAKEYGFNDTDTILKHDMLAFLRIQDAFEAFMDSGFTEYDKEALEEERSE